MEITTFLLYQDGMSGVVSLLTGLVLLYIRYKARDTPMTKSQGWGLSLLAWLFLCNAFLALEGLYSFIVPTPISNLTRLDLPVVAPGFLIAFGLVFPQPVVRPSRLPLLFLFLSGITGIVILMQLGGHSTNTIIQGWGDIQNTWIYTGWFIPVLRWVTLYRKNRAHPEISLILTLLIWGVLYHALTRLVLNDLVSKSPTEVSRNIVFFSNVFQTLMLITVALIVHQLYERRKTWGLAEKIHLFMFGMLTVLYSVAYCLKEPSGSIDLLFIIAPVNYLISEAGILIIRPALIIYAMLVYQFFGPELRSERPIILLTTIMIAYFGGVFISFWFYGLGFNTMGIAGFVAFIALLVPAFLLARTLIYKLVPSTRKMSRNEVRNLYFVSMFGALFKGSIEDKEDGEALSALRKRLGLTDREHALIAEGERARAREERPVNRIRYAIFVKDSGTHVASVGPMGDKDEAVLASMLTAVRMFIKDAFGGATGDLDTIQYGDSKLLMEWERGYILALDMDGEYDPTSRVLVGDLLALLIRRHWKVLNEWDGDQSVVSPVQETLTTLVINYNKTGTL